MSGEGASISNSPATEHAAAAKAGAGPRGGGGTLPPRSLLEVRAGDLTVQQLIDLVDGRVALALRARDLRFRLR